MFEKSIIEIIIKALKDDERVLESVDAFRNNIYIKSVEGISYVLHLEFG